MIPAECEPIITRAGQLERASKTRSKAEHRREALEALNKLRAESPICFTTAPVPGEPSAPTNALPVGPVGSSVTGSFIPGSNPLVQGAQPTPVTPQMPWGTILIGGIAVVGIGYVVLGLLKPTKGRRR